MSISLTRPSFWNKKFFGVICYSSAAYILALLGQVESSIAQSQLQVKNNRYLQVEQVNGTAFFRNQNANRPARRGDRLTNVGDEIVTDAKSTVVLSIDTGVGFVNVSEQTIVRINALQVTNDNGRVTILQVPRGIVRLKIRRFTNPSSRFDLQTPAVVTGVRGTEYLVNVKNDGRTVLATLDGGVLTSAQNVDVLVNKGFQNQTIVGSPPSQPIPIQDNTDLDYQVLKYFEYIDRQVFFVGKVDFANTVTINGVEQNVDQDGQFRTALETNSIFRTEIQVIVTTPSGKQSTYDLVIY